MTDPELALLAEWESDLRVICHGHYYAATQLDRLSYWIGIPAIVLASAAGSSALATMSERYPGWLATGASMASLTAAVLASAQLFLRLPERAERHRAVAARFGALLREVEQTIASPPTEGSAFAPWGSDMRSRWDEVARDTAAVPHRIWKTMYARYKEK